MAFTKRAVCVGINYPGTSAQLSGCVNDANDWADLFHASGYKEVRVLLDGAATKAAILGALRAEVAKMTWGDRLVFTYSGHGTWVPDRSGDEVDGRDEALCPSDFTRGASYLITDDELHEALGGYPRGTGILVISDSCHSGTMSRFAGMTGGTGPGVPRFIPPSEIFDGLSEERAAAIEETFDAKGPRRTTSLVSGCLDHEFSYDAWFGPRANGAFSRVAIDAHRPGISLNAWHKAIRQVLPNGSFPQTPALSPSSLYRKYAKAI